MVVVTLIRLHSEDAQNITKKLIPLISFNPTWQNQKLEMSFGRMLKLRG